KPAIAEALKLADMPAGRFPLEWNPETFSPKTQSDAARPVSELLRAEGFRRAEVGDIEGAMLCHRALLNAARSIGDEPTAGQSARRSLAGVTVQSAERTLAQGEPREADLAQLQKMFEEEAGVN